MPIRTHLPATRRCLRLLWAAVVILTAWLMPTAAKAEETPDTTGRTQRESIFGNRTKPLSESHFTWGAEVGSSIDISGYDTSTFDADVMFGYKNGWFKILGVGAGIHRAFGTGDNFVPVYAVVRTSFSRKPRLFFLSFKAGYSFNTMGDSPTFGDTNSALGAGVNLAFSRRFKSHIVLAYEFRHFNARHKSLYDLPCENISLATISFGVNF